MFSLSLSRYSLSARDKPSSSVPGKHLKCVICGKTQYNNKTAKYNNFNHILSKWQCGFCKGFSTQHCLLVMIENWRKCLDKWGISGAILTDLSKAFDCILHDLLIAKLAAYGFDYQSLRIMESFLSNRQQRTKINNAFSLYSGIRH